MYRKILIANRADCALRLIQACHDENIEACLICARDDASQTVISQADDVIYTGMTREAYTSPENILEAALSRDCEAILPGWGFLSEDFAFARRCRHLGLHFIGPKTQHIQLFGDKLKTIQTLSALMPMHSQAMPCNTPNLTSLLKDSGQTCWMLKPRCGGGGKGLESFQSHEALIKRLTSLSKNLRHYYVEPLIPEARHIEFQIFGDGMGRIDVMGCRDCTPQVHHQKWLEQSVDMTANPMLSQLCDELMHAFASLKYQSWGTVEFLVHDEKAVLLEVNPRLQVEHGVTEMALNTDIVRRAIRLSCMGPLGFERVKSPNNPPCTEHAECLEFRLYARTAGIIQNIGFHGLEWPHHKYESDPTYRLETGCRPGDQMTGIYDGMLARFIVQAAPNQALEKLKSWLQDWHIEGIETNINDLNTLPSDLNTLTQYRR
jgi:acetyl/propionyl-CoA carboxylase alpha subunit